VLVSPQRNRRPWQGQIERINSSPRPVHDANCYLCPGNARAGGLRNPRYEGPFVFANDFSALAPSAPEPMPTEDLLLTWRRANGVCRVLCFSHDHSKTLPELGLDEIEAVVSTWTAQTEELGRQWTWVQIFENKGEVMGCSNPHPHGQIWATDFVPDEPALEDAHQRAYYQAHRSPMLLDLAEVEIRRAERVVVQTTHWLAIVPFWAAWPFETLLLPRAPVARMNDLNSEQASDLALALQQLTTRYDNLFECSFPYSMGWHGAPHDARDASAWQLHAHFYPPLLRSSSVRKFMVGFEMLAQPQRDITPEQAAAALRATRARHFRAGVGGPR
jgi:UDPglucose--hexose-1-phosphate uridylyltransferase